MPDRADLASLAPRYRHILDTCTPFLLSYTGNLPELDLAPFGVEIDPEHRFTPTSLKSRDLVDSLHRLDGFSFGPQEMLMPRWVLFDCGEFPGIVFGFGRKASELSGALRSAYRVEEPEKNETFVALSMWVAIRCAEPDAWFGHNLSSVRAVEGCDELAGMGTLTKALGIRLARAKRQYGATQWTSGSITLHLNYGEMKLLSAYTPAHTHIETLSYLIDVDARRLADCLTANWKRPEGKSDFSFVCDDSRSIVALHERIEAGEELTLVRVERVPDKPQRVYIRVS